jgi:hypothetical protein
MLTNTVKPKIWYKIYDFIKFFCLIGIHRNKKMKILLSLVFVLTFSTSLTDAQNDKCLSDLVLLELDISPSSLSINLHKQGLTCINQNVFNGYVNLKNLIISWNNITTLKENSFVGAINLQELWLTWNYIFYNY